jgi:hypothetical protein
MARFRLLLIIFIAGFISNSCRAEDCPPAEVAGDVFLSKTTPPRNAMPSPPTNNDCAFYNWAWHMFLFVTQPQEDGRPAFLSYETIEDVFGPSVARSYAKVSVIDRKQNKVLSLAPRSAKLLSEIPALGGGFKQAGDLDAILVDQNHNAVYYAIHLNAEYSRFVRDNGLNKLETLINSPAQNPGDVGAPANLEFRTGAVEIKSAWQIVEPNDPHPNYFTTKARVPQLKNSNGEIVRDGEKTREVTVALLGLHVVGVIDGHPEFIWASFEHADDSGKRDIAPAAKDNPVAGNVNGQVIENADRTYPLFKKGETAANANQFHQGPIDEASQKFSNAASIYREYPGSQAGPPDPADKPDPTSPWEDPAIFSLNKNMGVLFDARDPAKADMRRNYRLVAAVWIDKPDGVFKEAQRFPDAVLAGENRFSNMSMESFTQDENGSPNCFSCHNTRDSAALDSSGKSLPARRINVSHIFEFFAKSVLESKQ